MINQFHQNAYSLPLPDDVQEQLASSIKRCGYWKVPVPDGQAKTVFSPGPGMGLRVLLYAF